MAKRDRLRTYWLSAYAGSKAKKWHESPASHINVKNNRKNKMAIETTGSWRDIGEIIIAQLREQSPLLAEALLNQCTVAYHQQDGAVQLLLPHYDAALKRLTKGEQIAYDQDKDLYLLIK